MKKNRLLYFSLLLLMLASTFLAAGDTAASLTGKWQLSWEARLGTERGTIQIEQVGTKLSGTYQGRLGSSKAYGNMEGQHINLNIDFGGAAPFTISFTGTVDGDKMGGKFAIKGADDGYDSHGENARPSDYSWKAIRQPNQTESLSSGQNQPGAK
ncbi:MAG: hypothetical protein WB919_16090 [Candidatus Sulfotelmatobacter sp.]